MVYAYVGLPGSGKTLSSLALLLSELRAGRHVFANIAGLDPTMVAYALSAKRGEHFGLTYVEKYLHRFTLDYDVDLGSAGPVDGSPSALGSAPAPAVPFVPRRFGARRFGASPVANVAVPSRPAAVSAEAKSAAVPLENIYRVKKKNGMTGYFNSEGLSLLIKDVMSCRETVVILDECHEYLNPENFSLLRPFVKYISMARHYGHDLVLITQHISDIWQPIQKRVHETHEFFRGQLGLRAHYKERVFYGCNVLAAPGYVRQRVNDKSLYRLYDSHSGGAREHLGYMSIWKNRRFIAMLLFLLLIAVFVFFQARRSFVFLDKVGKADGRVAARDSVHRYSRSGNVLYVKYVVCGNYDCKAIRPDGTSVTIPLDYASGRYPLEVRKYVQNGNGYYPSGSGAGPKPR